MSSSFKVSCFFFLCREGLGDGGRVLDVHVVHTVSKVCEYLTRSYLRDHLIYYLLASQNME